MPDSVTGYTRLLETFAADDVVRVVSVDLFTIFTAFVAAALEVLCRAEPYVEKAFIVSNGCQQDFDCRTVL